MYIGIYVFKNLNSISFCMFIFFSFLVLMFFWSLIGFASFFLISRFGLIMDSFDKILFLNLGKLFVN